MMARKRPALASCVTNFISPPKDLIRDRGVDETGGQIAVFGRKGPRPLNLEEMRKLYLDAEGNPWYVKDD